MNHKYQHTAYFCLTLLFAIFVAQGAVAQNYRDVTIIHKKAKWYDVREQQTQAPADDFDEDTPWQSGAKGDIQATHTSIQTIYARKGSTVRLYMTDYHPNGSMSNRTYQRWYNYQTDGLFNDGMLTRATRNLPTTIDNGTTIQNGAMYQFANGYVGQPAGTSSLYAVDFHFPENGQDYYLVGCDVSGYQDFREKYANNGSTSDFSRTHYEPTLSHRYIFFIRSIEDTSTPANIALRAGEPIEVNNISMPATRINNMTQEMIALQMDAKSYLTLNERYDNSNLVVTIPDQTNNAGIQLLDVNIRNNTYSTTDQLNLSGEERIIFFQYPKDNGNGTRSVNNLENGQSSSVIEVRRGETLVAQFNITFKEDSRLLTQTQVEKIEDGDYQQGGILSNYTFRSPSAISGSYQLLTEMNFDFDEQFTAASVFGEGGRPQIYPYPLGWDDISYGFFDGSYNCFEGIDSRAPQWGYYAITKGYVEAGNWSGWTNQGVAPEDNVTVRKNSEGNNSTFHLYADVSDRPGIIARLPFSEQLCSGTELFITAWVKCVRDDPKSNNASALFSIMGVTNTQTADGKRTVYTPIYRFQTGQIPYTLRNNTAGGEVISEYEGYDQGKNDWMQVYFSFINEADANFDSYALQVDNNCAATRGGDIYIDDIRVYIATPDAKITQLEATCTNERTMTNIQLDWERLTQRLGVNTNAGEIGAGSDPVTAFDYCFVDAKTYNDFLAKEGNATNYAGAIEAAVVEIGDSTQYNQKYVTIYFHNIFDNNKKANQVNGTVVHPNLLVNNKQDDGNYYLYSMTERGSKYLTGDFYAAFVPNREYWMLMKPHSDTETVDANWFAQDIDSPCASKRPSDRAYLRLLRGTSAQLHRPSACAHRGERRGWTAHL